MTTVDEIIGTGRPSLAERAKQAHEQRTEDQQIALEQHRDVLISEILDWLQCEVGVDAGTRAAIKFTPAGVEKGLPVVTFRCEGVAFRGRYDSKKIKVDTSSDYEEQFLAMQVSKSPSPAGPSAWTKVETLADIGKVLS